VFMQEVGRFLMLEPYVGTCVIAPALLRHAGASLRAELLPAICEGRAIVALADAEPGSRFSLTPLTTQAVKNGTGFVLTGDKSHALDGAEADFFLIPARTHGQPEDADGISLFLVPATAPGLTISAARAIDHRHNASLRLAAVAVPGSAIVGLPGQASSLIEYARDLGIAARLAESVGAMEAVQERTLAHLRARRQFGQPIAGFQALQHRAVDMAIGCEEARSMTYLATLSLSRPAAERRRVVSAAKARVSQTSLFVGRQGVQLHGGIGFSDELDISHYLKRLIMIDMCFGNAAEHRNRLAAAERQHRVAADALTTE
jgi:alkylation response protein AidB-like acyl-CoA dehydrogenase